MSFRNLSPQSMFFEMALAHKPRYRFADCGSSFETWKTEALPQVLATLGDFPTKAPLAPELMGEWKHEGLKKQRWLIDVQPGLSAVCLVNYPAGLKKGEKRPALLCCHGHGPFGKEPVMGNNSTEELRASISTHHYDYGHRMAKDGYITFAIDWIGFGERNDNNKPNFRNANGERDWCNLYYLHATMLGMTSLSINVAHGMAATSFASTLPEVDSDRLGVMGLSGGGTMTLWMALCDERFRAAEIICYSDLWAYFGFRDINYCGMQVAPGLYKLVDLPDLQGLLAPKPLLVDVGAYDSCFKIDTAMACYRQVEAIYSAAGAADKLELDLHSREHGWGGNKSADFFGEYLLGNG